MESEHLDLKLRIAVIDKGDRGHATNKKVSWGRLCQKLSTPVEDRKYTLPEYLDLPIDRQNKFKDVGSFVGGPFQDGLRKGANLIERSIVTLDIDNAHPEQIEMLQDGSSKLCKYEFFASTTRKHSKFKPRWRVVMPVTRPITIEEYGPLARILASMLFGTVAESMDATDDVSFRPAQIMYWPSVCRNALFETIENPGKLLNPSIILDRFGDWQDWSRLPFSEARGQKRPTTGQKAEDPRNKRGMVGAFCRAFDVPAAIEEFLPDKYELGDENSLKPRYTYLLGSSSNGAVVEDDGLFLYSHHGTDPCSDRLVNSFDLVRIHKFGDLDVGAPDDCAPVDLPSYKAMKSLCREYPEVADEMETYDDYEPKFDDLGDSDEDDDDFEHKKPEKREKTEKKSRNHDDSDDEEDEKPKKKKAKSGDSDPDMTLIRGTKMPTPDLPLDVFGDFWSAKAIEWATASAAPVDYTAFTMLVGAASLIGNSRWVQARPGWTEPPVLWCALVGRPSANKSPAVGNLTKILSNLEMKWAPIYEESLRDYEMEKKATDQRRKMWEAELADKLEQELDLGEDNPELPTMPKNCVEPVKPERRRAFITDVTLEKMMLVLAGNPRGVLNLRDELAGWFLNLSRYTSGTDRPAWLEAYGGRPYSVDRVKYEDKPLHVRHFGVSLLGGIQPERLGDVLRSNEDGLQARFMYVWPEEGPKQLAEIGDSDNSVERAFERLSELTMEPNKYGSYDPKNIPLTAEAWQYFKEWAYEQAVAAQYVSPALQAAYGKANGLVLRIALTLQFMWWSCKEFESAEEPEKVGLKAIKAAIRLRDQYIKPMQTKTFGQTDAHPTVVKAATVAQWLYDNDRSVISVREIRKMYFTGLKENKDIVDALECLEHKNWISATEPKAVGKGGRPEKVYAVNPKIHEL